MRDGIVTVVVATVLALVFMYALLTLVFGGWGDPPSGFTSSAIRDKAPSTIVDSM